MNTKYKLNLDNYAELEKTLEDQKNAYLESNDELVKSDTNLREEKWIIDSGLSVEKFTDHVFSLLSEHKNRKIVFEILKNPYLPKDCLVKLAEVKQQYTNEELYQIWLVLKHPNCEKSIFKEICDLEDSYEVSLLKKAVASNSTVDINIIKRLLKNDYRWVRQAAASHTSLNQEDIIELVEIAKSGVTESQKENDEGDRYTLKGLLDNKNIDIELKERLSSLLEDEDTYPKQFTKYYLSLSTDSDSHQRIAGGHISLEVISSLLIETDEDGFLDIASTFLDSWDDWSDYTDHYDEFGWDSGGGILYISDSSVGLDEEEFELDSYEIEKPLLKCIDKLEIGNFFMDVKSYNNYDDGHFEEIVQEEELNIWECINTFYYGLYDSNTIFGAPESSVVESDSDRESKLYVKDSKTSFNEIELEDLYNEIKTELGDDLNEENVSNYLKLKFSKISSVLDKSSSAWTEEEINQIIKYKKYARGANDGDELILKIASHSNISEMWLEDFALSGAHSTKVLKHIIKNPKTDGYLLENLYKRDNTDTWSELDRVILEHPNCPESLKK